MGVPTTGQTTSNDLLPVAACQGPFGGTPWAVPGMIQAEDFDTGGNTVAYLDDSAGNTGGQYRTDEDVDIKVTTDTGGGHAVGWWNASEWLEYTVDVATAGSYDLDLRIGSANAGRTVHVEFGGVDVTGPVTVPQMGGWDQYQTVTVPDITLTAGEQIMRVVQEGPSNGVDFNWIELTASGGGQSPFGGTPWAVPGTVQAEDFDVGGNGVAYFDDSAGNTGGQYRTNEDVDIKVTTDAGGGHAVGWWNASEWLEYTVDVATAGSYDLDLRIGSANAGRTVHVEFGGLDVTGPVTVPQMGGWDQYQTVTVTGISLDAGEQVMKVVQEENGNGVDFNWIELN